jgi:DNA helicase II / ATP-dependent DNA helicase PcrA
MELSNELNNRQKEAVSHAFGPLLVIAGAGSGKTRTLVSRLSYLIEKGAEPSTIMAITFTNKAADEMRNRIAPLINKSPSTKLPFIGTFHSFGARILRHHGHHLGRTNRFTIYDSDDSARTVKKIIKELGIPKETATPYQIQRELSRVKNELSEPEDTLDEASLQAFNRYEAILQESNAFDFDDLIQKVVVLLSRQKNILENYQNRYRHILVDEFQDVNCAQYELVKLLGRAHRSVNVVGDDAQSIYRFRNADFRNFLNFKTDWPETKIVTLDQNYRSTQLILDAAAAVIKNNTVQMPKKLWTEKKEGDLVTIIQAPNAEVEAETATHLIQEAQRLHPSHSIAVLYRTNAQSRAIETELIVSDVPYRIYGGVRFYDRKEVKDIIAALRVIQNPKDTASQDRLRATFLKRKSAEVLKALATISPETSPAKLIASFLEISDYFEYLKKKFPNVRERVENIQELLAFAETFTQLEEFIERVSLLQSTDEAAHKQASAKQNNSPRVPAIHLTTIHLAKGLEFDTVFVVGCSEGLLPHQLSYGTLEELEEERRLMYVAMTRAKQKLFLTFSRFPSRFLYEIPGDLTIFSDLTFGRPTLPSEDEMYIE